MNTTIMGRIAVAGGLVLALAQVSAAQVSGAPTPQSTSAPTQGPLVIEQVKDRWVVAPDVRVTEMDDRLATLVGGYGGMVVQEHLLIGGAGYWLANGEDDFKMTYGGLVAGWLAQPTRLLGVGARALVGIGDATLSSSYAFAWRGGSRHDVPSRPGPFGANMPGTVPPVTPVVQRVIFSHTFLVFEPQADVTIRFASWGRVVFGGGYRVVGLAEGLEDRLRGPSGSVAIRFGGSGS